MARVHWPLEGAAIPWEAPGRPRGRVRMRVGLRSVGEGWGDVGREGWGP